MHADRDLDTGDSHVYISKGLGSSEVDMGLPIVVVEPDRLP